MASQKIPRASEDLGKVMILVENMSWQRGDKRQ